MAQQNLEIIPVDPASSPLKRKRGRPRKCDVPGYEPRRRNRHSQATPAGTIPAQASPAYANPTASSSHLPCGLIGQQVSGVLEGTFDAGYLITVRVGGTGPVFKGLVFDPTLSVPLTVDNDVAPLLPMSRRYGNLHPVPQAPSQEPVSTPGHPASGTVTVAVPLRMRQPATPFPYDASQLPQDVRPALKSDLKNIHLETLSKTMVNDEPPISQPAAPQQSVHRCTQTGISLGPSYVMNDAIAVTIGASSGHETETMVEAAKGCKNSNQTEGSSVDVSRTEQCNKALTNNETSGGKLNYTDQEPQFEKSSINNDKNLMGDKMSGGKMDLVVEVSGLKLQASENRELAENLQNETEQANLSVPAALQEGGIRGSV